MNLREITLAVLAGGAGTRMGVPKAQLQVRGKPILDWLLARWGWEGPKLLVTAPGREHPPGREGFDREAIDAVPDQGPMRGVVTALDAVGTEMIVVATCDMPLVGRHQLVWLAQRLVEWPARSGLFIARQNGAAMKIEPFPCAVRRSAMELLNSRLAAGDFAMHSLAELQQFELLACPDDWAAETWLNLNRPDDLKALEHALL